MKGEEDAGEEEAVEELQTLIETVEDEGVIDEDRSELLHAALDFSEISAQEAMTARVDMVAVDIDDDWEEIIAQVEEAPYSRLPVYEDSIDNIIGVLYLNHFLKALTDGDRADIRKLLMPPCYVYKTMKLPAVLNQLRRAKQHLAIVSDDGLTFRFGYAVDGKEMRTLLASVDASYLSTAVAGGFTGTTVGPYAVK
jgi:CBS domain containing-hemolysin-like protein